MSNIIISEDFEEAKDFEVAKEVGEVLHTAYPGYLWAVEMPQHNIMIRLIDAPIQGMGMFINRKNIPTTPGLFKRQIVFMAGEFLERAGMNRGAKRDGDQIYRVEGTELRHYVDPLAKFKAFKAGDK